MVELMDCHVVSNAAANQCTIQCGQRNIRLATPIPQVYDEQHPPPKRLASKNRNTNQRWKQQ